MSDRLFDIDEYPEVPLFREPRRSRGAPIMDERIGHDYPPEWSKCPTCEGKGKTWGEIQTREAGPLRNDDEIQFSFKTGNAVLIAGVLDAVGSGEYVGYCLRDTVCADCLGMGSVKARVRLEAGHRCVRCLHPYMPKGDAKMLGVEPSGVGGEHMGGRWSACDERCMHGGPLRMIGYPMPCGDIGRPPEPAPYVEREGGVVAGVEVAAGYELEAEWRILTVHHLDGDKANLRWWNLVALDQRCHLEIQAKIVMERVYPHEHSSWFRPFAAGYYAFVYLCKVCGLPHGASESNHRGRPGEPMGNPGPINEAGYWPHPFEPGLELTREQTTERLDELLALERTPV